MQVFNWIIFVFPVISRVDSGMYLFFFFQLIYFYTYRQIIVSEAWFIFIKDKSYNYFSNLYINYYY